LQPADGNIGAKWTTQQLASAAPKGCYSTTVDTRPGTVAPVANGINVRFDMYDLPYFHGNEKNNSEFRPAPVVTKGKFYASGPKICDYNNTNTDIDLTDPDGPDCPLGAVPPVGVPFPIHACFATDTCAADEPTWIHPRFQPPADATQSAQEIFWTDYWSTNHAGNDFNVLFSMIDADGDQIVTRLEMYTWEVSAPNIPLGDVDGDGTPGELGAVTGTSGGDEGKSTATGENGSPMKYGGAEPPEASRRMMPVAVINCIADGPINGASTNVPVVAFAKMFLSHPAEDEDDKAIYAEMVGVLKPGVDNEILHDIIQLYR